MKIFVWWFTKTFKWCNATENMYDWSNALKSERLLLKDGPSEGHPVKAVAPEINDAVHKMIKVEHHILVQEFRQP